MYDFIQQMFDFAVSEVLESRWAELKKKLDAAETVDQLLKDHDNFLNTCTNECLLTNEKLLDVGIFSAFFFVGRQAQIDIVNQIVTALP